MMGEKWTILVASSDASRILSAARAIRHAGWDHVLAGDAAQALAQARQTAPHAVVLDARLAAGGALITVKRLRNSLQTAAIPVVVTGEVSAEQRDALVAAGAQAFLMDTATDDLLCSALREVLTVPTMPVSAPASVLSNPVRLAAVRASGLLDSPPERAFDRVTHLAATLLSAPAAMISLLDNDRQFFKSQVGLDQPWAAHRQIPLTHSFCPWVVAGREPVAVNDARDHPFLCGNPAIRDLGVVAYTGAPISTGQGETLGSICAVDSRPRDWSADDIATLTDLSRMAECCVAGTALVRQPPASPAELDHYVEATGMALDGAIGILRRSGETLLRETRELLYEMVREYGYQLVQLNRLIQVNQVLRVAG